MPINKDLNVSPYFDDFDETKNFYKILFKPSVAVQVRELNQLQTVLQEQVEKFGNNIYKRGTIIDGVNFIYYPNYSYIKIKDSQLNGDPSIPAGYISNFITDPSSNLTAHIINGVDGFEATDPDLKTIYIRYINSGNDGNTIAFSPNSTLRIYDYLDSIDSIIINNGSSGFSNTDSVVFCSALDITKTSNVNFTVGETITNTGSTKFAIITAITSVNGKNVLQIKPQLNDLVNTSISSLIWQFDNQSSITGLTSGAAATVNSTIGSGASATITTSADIGKIVVIDVTYGGSGYYVSPYTTIKSSGTTSTIGSRNYTDLDLISQNYIAQVTVAGVVNSVGTGYAFGVTEGIIYQKGYFVRVTPQTIIVDKYDSTPDNISVGFDTIEDIIDSNIDQSLLDQSTGTTNQFAPGADRLKLTPTLITANTSDAEANTEFLSLVDFSEGKPLRENRRTQFNSIEDEMALRTKESSGDFVLDPFLVTTQSTPNSANEGKQFSLVVDPGKGYLNGYRIETKSNYYIDCDKGIDGKTSKNLSATINYGNFVYVTQVTGAWNCNIGTTINLLDTAQGAIDNTTNISSGTLTPVGNVIGTARVRNIVYDSGETGTDGAIYRLYLFNIVMNAGKQFSSIRGYQIGSTTGLADAITQFNATSNSNINVLQDTTSGSSLLVPTASDATRNISNLNYVYRQTNDSVSLSNTGSASFLLTDSTETFGYVSTSLTDPEKKSVLFIPTSGDAVFVPNTTSDGTAAVTSGSNTVTISSSSVNKYSIGDWIALFSASSTYILRRVTNKTTTTLSLDSTASFSNAAASFSHAYPKNVPMGFHRISGATITTTGGDKTINLNLNSPIISASSVTCSLTYDVSVTGAVPQSKTATRNNFVKLQVSAGNVNGPWCLGIPDIFRLDSVYLGSNSSVDTTATDVTDQFYIDPNQTSDYYGLGYLFKNSDANITITGSSWLLVKFDAYTSTPGVFTLNSYVSSDVNQRFADDSLALTSLGTKTNSFEVPEVHTSDGKYFDLLNCIDFRPICTATASYANTAASANTNPSSTLTFSGSSKKFPLPETGVQFDRETFLGRTDVVVVNSDDKIKVIRGTPSLTPFSPLVPSGVLLLNRVDIPPYPCVPAKFSSTMLNILNKRVASERYLIKRVSDRTITIEVDEAQRKLQQPRGYTMSDIGQLDRRITDLEYNVSLTMIESDLKDKVIPSNASPGLNRFKFGFFVDDYTTTNYSDTQNVEYRCDVVDSKVVPVSMSIGTGHGPKNPASGACVQAIDIITQAQASTPAPPPVVSNTVTSTPPPSSNTVSSNTIVSTPNTTPITFPTITAKFVTLTKSTELTKGARTYTTGWITFSSVPSTYTLDYNFYSDADNLLIEKISLDGSTVTTILNLNLINKGTFQFNHNPDTGRNYRLTVFRESAHWQWTLTYPIDNITYSNPTPPSANVGTIYFMGALQSITPGTFTPPSMAQNFGDTAYCALGVQQTIHITSLKPSTVHNVGISGSTTGITVKPKIISSVSGGSISNSQIITDSSGNAFFDMVIDNSAISNIDALLGKSSATVPDNIYVTISSTDGTSICGFIVRIETGATSNNGFTVIAQDIPGGIDYNQTKMVSFGKYEDFLSFIDLRNP
jgi:hypothetical protein